MPHSLTFRAKVKVIAKIKANALRNKNMPPQKNLSRGSIGVSNWCDTDIGEDAYIVKTIC